MGRRKEWPSLSKGGEKSVRRIKQITREQLDKEEFRRNEKLAIEVIQKNCKGIEYSSDWGMVLAYWKLRHTYFDKEVSDEYKKALDDFNKQLPENLDLNVSTALRVISLNFAKHPGRS